MHSWAITLVAGILVSVAFIWLVLIVAYAWVKPDRATLKEAVRLPVDVAQLARRLLSDRELPRGARMRLWLLLGYLLMPIDLVPDFIPVIGYADDAIIVFFLLRGAIRQVGMNAIEENWPGSPDGLDVVRRLCRL